MLRRSWPPPDPDVVPKTVRAGTRLGCPPSLLVSVCLWDQSSSEPSSMKSSTSSCTPSMIRFGRNG